jgi:hypothetical protein
MTHQTCPNDLPTCCPVHFDGSTLSYLKSLFFSKIIVMLNHRWDTRKHGSAWDNDCFLFLRTKTSVSSVCNDQAERRHRKQHGAGAAKGRGIYQIAVTMSLAVLHQHPNFVKPR